MTVRVLDGWSDAEWDEEARRHPEATVFHTRAWARISSRSFSRLRDASVWLEVDSPAGRSRHLLPLHEWRRARGLVTTAHSSFPHLYGGPVPSHGAGSAPVLPAVLAWLGARRGTTLLTGNPLAIATHGAEIGAGSAAGWEAGTLRTHFRSLPATAAEFWDGELRTQRRNDVRRLTKRGVTVEESRSPEDVRAFYQLYLASFARWGGRPAFLHPEALYQNLIQLGGPSVRFTVARFEGRVLGGTFTLRHGLAVHYFAGYFDAEAKALRPNVLLQVDSIARAIADGFRYYDFLPSGGNAAVEQFKEGFGGKALELPVWARRSRRHRLIARLRAT